MVWDALTGLGTLLLAVVTAVGIRVSLRLWRKEQARDDRLRQADRDEWNCRRERERQERADAEAHRVTLEMLALPDPATVSNKGEILAPDGRSYLVTLSMPVGYQTKWEEFQIAYDSPNGARRPYDLGYRRLESPVIDHDWRRYRRSIKIPSEANLNNPQPVAQFVDGNGFLYFTCMHQTLRFPQGTDWSVALEKLDLWVRTGAGAPPPEVDAS